MTSNILRAASLVLAGICALIANPADAERSSVMKQKIDALFAKWDVAGSPGASIAVIADDRVLYLKGYGYADLEHGIRNTPETVFHIASVSKQFTGVAALIAEEEGILKIDGPISQYVADAPSVASKITLRELLYHTGGLRDTSTLQILSGHSLEDVFTKERVFMLINNQRGLNFAPGTMHSYSNTGYILAAEAIERASGKTFANFTAQKIFQPLGMTNSRFNDDYRNVIAGSANSYSAKPDGSFGRSALNLGYVGSTNVKTTAVDMAKWAQFVIDGKKNGFHMPKALYEPGALSDGKPIPYGFGMFFNTYHGQRSLEHGGADSAFRAYLMVVPARRFAVVIMTNTDSIPAGDLARKVADIILGAPSKAAPPPADNSPTTVVDGEKYAGIYLLENQSTLNVVAKPEGLVVLDNGTETPLRPIGQDTFAVRDGELKIKFERDAASGAYTTLSIQTESTSDLARRLIEKEVPAGQLNGVAGSYYSPEVERFFDVYVEQGKVTTRISAGMKLPLQYLGDNTFIHPASGSRITFIRDNKGGIQRAMLSSARMQNVELVKMIRPGE